MTRSSSSLKGTFGLRPYTSDVDASTHFARARRANSSAFSLPRWLMRSVSRAFPYRGNLEGGEVDDALVALSDAVEGGNLRHVTPLEMKRRVAEMWPDVLDGAHREVVDADDLMATGQQLREQVGTQESGDTGDDDLQETFFQVISVVV